jgi:hypothetical protein
VKTLYDTKTLATIINAEVCSACRKGGDLGQKDVDKSNKYRAAATVSEAFEAETTLAIIEKLS